MSYLFEGLWAIDPKSPSNVAANGTLVICDPDDPSHQPLVLTDADGVPVENPVAVNEKGFVPAFRADLDRVAWYADGLSGYVTSYDGIRENLSGSREAAQVAADSAQQSTSEAANARLAAEEAASLVNAPADGTMATLLAGATESNMVALEMISRATERSFTVKTIPPTEGSPGYTLIRVKHGTSSGPFVRHALGGDSMSSAAVLESFESYWGRTQPSVIFNGGGWWSTNRRNGLEIKDGVLIQDWETDPTYKLGVECGVFMRDGSFRIYDRGTPGAQIVDDGGWNASSWGQAVYRDGALTRMKEDPYWQGVSARQALGNTLTGDLILLTVPGKTGIAGATTDQITDIVEPLGIENLIYLDGGGSTQTWVNGIPVVPSSDASGSRAVASVYYFTAPMATASTRTSGWTSFSLNEGFAATSGNQVPLWNLGTDTLALRGSISGSFPSGGALVGTIGFRPGAGVEYVGTVIGPNSIVGKIVISSVGEVRIFGPVNGGLSYARLDQCNWRLA